MYLNLYHIFDFIVQRFNVTKDEITKKLMLPKGSLSRGNPIAYDKPGAIYELFFSLKNKDSIASIKAREEKITSEKNKESISPQKNDKESIVIYESNILVALKSYIEKSEVEDDLKNIWDDTDYENFITKILAVACIAPYEKKTPTKKKGSQPLDLPVQFDENSGDPKKNKNEYNSDPIEKIKHTSQKPYISKEDKLKSVLSFKNNTFTITTPFYKRKVFDEDLDVIIADEVELQNKLIVLLTKINMEYIVQKDNLFNNNNEIHIGGSPTNVHTSYYMQEYFPKFRWHLTKKEEDIPFYTDFQKVHRDQLKFGQDHWGFKYGDNENDFLTCIKDEIDYALIIKLTNVGLHKDNTVHLIYGADGKGTPIAVDYFIKNYETLYDKFQNKPYCAGVKLSLKTHTPCSGDILDLTEKMFAD